MPSKCETPRDGGTSRNSCGGHFRESVICPDHFEQAFVDYIHQFVPNAQGEELDLRLALMKARDYSAKLRGDTVSHLAHSHACDAHEMAGGFIFADVPTPRLKIAARYCRHTVMAAFLAEHLDAEGTGL